ncbi:MAG: hypothetical protein KatS3mg002_1330 [Candidatus Woesearchaeota archaeon]|nr:MAG: hypothetical protein KatS3mg002_1330 [Candidatus Woesearchaeota archaeon]
MKHSSEIYMFHTGTSENKRLGRNDLISVLKMVGNNMDSYNSYEFDFANMNNPYMPSWGQYMIDNRMVENTDYLPDYLPRTFSVLTKGKDKGFVYYLLPILTNMVPVVSNAFSVKNYTKYEEIFLHTIYIKTPHICDIVISYSRELYVVYKDMLIEYISTNPIDFINIQIETLKICRNILNKIKQSKHIYDLEGNAVIDTNYSLIFKSIINFDYYRLVRCLIKKNDKITLLYTIDHNNSILFDAIVKNSSKILKEPMNELHSWIDPISHNCDYYFHPDSIIIDFYRNKAEINIEDKALKIDIRNNYLHNRMAISPNWIIPTSFIGRFVLACKFIKRLNSL